VHLVDENVKTGAPISFLNLERFNLGRKMELENLAKMNGSAAGLSGFGCLPGTPEEIAEIRQNAVLLPKYMVAMFEINKIVYCRYGRDYIPSVAKQI
jgi:hypothetical protein